MPNRDQVEDAVKILVSECCPQHASLGDGHQVFGAPQPVGALPWAQIVVVLKTLLPVILDLLSKVQQPVPSPDPKPPFPV